MSKIWVLGSLNVDMTYYVDDLPTQGLTIFSNDAQIAAGGKGANQAVASAWNGTKVHLIGAVGKDGDGHFLEETVTGYGVDCSYLQHLDKKTGSAIIAVDKAGKNFIIVDCGANQCVPCQPLPFEEGDILVSQLETNLDAVDYYLKEAKAHGMTTILNNSPYRYLPKDILQSVDILVANEHEAGSLIGKTITTAEDAEDAIPGLDEAGIKAAVITLGENGAVVLENDTAATIPGIKVTAVDTQGAGDAFLGVLAGELASGSSLVQAASKANTIAAKCVTVKGSTLLSLPERT